jgi:uncharacterized membrane protein YoaK (UPF0700 family)
MDAVRAKRYLGATRTAPLLTVLAFAAGLTDATTYLALGNVFTANMTGNTVLLGIAIVSGGATRAVRSLCALASFVSGVACATLVLGRVPSGAAWPARARAVLAGELLTLIALAICGAAVEARGSNLFWLISLSGLAMGAQSAIVRAVRPSGVATTYITGTLTGLIADTTAVLTRRWRRATIEPAPRAMTKDAHSTYVHDKLALPAAIWATYLGAALLGAAATRPWGIGAASIAALPVGLVALRSSAH